MAAHPSGFEELLLCPVCREVFRDPVLLPCSHSFCRACVDRYWQSISAQTCPECRADACVERPPCNRALRSLCEMFLQERSRSAQTVCGAHAEMLQLFCDEDQELLCSACVRDHHGHGLRALEEAAAALKEALRTKLKPWQEKLKVLRSAQFICNQRVQHIKDQAEETEAQIKKEFEELHQFLRDEEEHRITAVREEERRKRSVLEEQMRSINADLTTLLEKMRSVEDQIQSSDVSLLQMKKNTVCESTPAISRSQVSGSVAQKLPEELMDVVKHLGNLKFRVWHKLRAVAPYVPVVLDPSTAHPCLVLSDGLSSAHLGRWSDQALGFRETSEGYTSVLGSEGFDSGTHSWDVEVGDITTWAVGVISESAIATRDAPPTAGLWRLGFHEGTYGQGRSGEFLSPLLVDRKLRRVTVRLDWDGGSVSFFDSLGHAHLHSFSHRFTDRVFPYFCSACASPALRVVPTD